MSPDAFHIALNRFAKRRPFRSFVIQLVTGEKIEVRHPEAVYVGKYVIAYISTERYTRFFDGWSVCQLLEVDEETLINLNEDDLNDDKF